MIEINPTCVPHDVEAIGRSAAIFGQFAPRIQVDLDDGKFAPHLTWPYTSPGTYESFTIPPVATLLEMHLMVEEPKELGILCALSGAERIIGHFEAFADKVNIGPTLDAWRESGAKEAGLAVLLQTPLEALASYIGECDFVLLMSIASIGVQGIPYDTGAPARVAAFHTRYPSVPIAVDGGVSKHTIADLVRAGATRFGVGSAISKAPDPEMAYKELRSLAENAVH